MLSNFIMLNQLDGLLYYPPFVSFTTPNVRISVYQTTVPFADYVKK